MKNPKRILISEDEPDWQMPLARLSRTAGFEVIQATTLQETTEALNNYFFNVVIVDLSLSKVDETRLDGVDTMRQIRSCGDATQAIVLTGRGTVALAVDFLRDFKVFHFLEKPSFDPSQFSKLLQNASEEAYYRIMSPGVLPNALSLVAPFDWDKVASQIQASPGDLQNAFVASVRATMPLRLGKGELVIPQFDAGTKTVQATVWSKWHGKSVLVAVGKRETVDCLGGDHINLVEYGKCAGVVAIA